MIPAGCPKAACKAGRKRGQKVRHRWAAIFVLAFALVRGSPRPAEAADVAAPSPRPFTAGLFLGLQSGLAFQYATAERGLMVDLSEAYATVGDRGSLTEIAISTRTSRAGGWLGARLGYQLASLAIGYPPGAIRDVSHTADVGLSVGATSQSGHTLALETGVEAVRRAHAVSCCDSGLSKSSEGVRMVVVAEIAVDPRLVLSARIGLRTGDHLLDISALPIAQLGMAFRF
jgi:hypothetical protein